MIRTGKLIRLKNNKVLFELDERVDPVELARLSNNKDISANIVFDDHRQISSVQRKKAYALIRDISRWTGYTSLEVKEEMKIDFMLNTDYDWISLSDCSVTEARHFISFLIEFSFEHNIPFKDKGLHLTDDVNRYLFLCIKYRKCAICGLHADIHHVEAIGLGRNRRKVDDSANLKMALCRTHHVEYHTIGQEAFDKKYRIQGIVVKDDERVGFIIR